jgi:ribosomal protein L6P/L9E
LLEIKGPYGGLSKYFLNLLLFLWPTNGKLVLKSPAYSLRNYKNLIFLKSLNTFISNLILDLIFGYSIQIDTRGIGYRIVKDKCYLFFFLGFSYILCYKLPLYLYINIINKNENTFNFFGFNRGFILQVVQFLLQLKKLDAYKGKGFYYFLENIILKEKQKKLN